ncbi:exo-alpha-sialidase [Trueperella pecoris]|uniref:exo-alpha-sialidase n=1 Tax=Trueperella pecoris TaxID=2733571 RepID=A0A7M1R014_9ACTO|nr:exo-alpha-sialidase [Trueperella pecoris]QOR47074.1 exo-alpha-sialidase [Trueperella pecoris]
MTPTLASAAPEATPKSAPVESSFRVLNSKADGFEEGDKIEFQITLKNDTDKARAFAFTKANIENYERCKWQRVEPKQTKEDCNFPYHVITPEDAATGEFTPRATWIMRTTVGHGSEIEKTGEVIGQPIRISNRLAALSPITITTGKDKTDYKVGDTFDYEYTVTSQSKETLKVDGLGCPNTALEPNKTMTCSAKYKVTTEDLNRGKANVSAKVTVSNKERSTVLTKSETVNVPQAWPKATAFKAPNADPRLDARLTKLQILDKDTSAYNIRIPAIAVASNGDILASYDLRPKAGATAGMDSPNENSIVQRRSTDGGKTWGPLTPLAEGKVAREGERFGWSDPSYVVDHTTGEIFNFHVGSLDAGLPNNPSYQLGKDGKVDVAHRRTMNFALASSTDNGRTWTSRLITDDILRDHTDKITGCFATSGAGIQKMHDPFKGRLLQQAACNFKSGSFRAITIYSDDHGKTWKGGKFAPATEGAPAGQRWNYDENKIVELSDGRLMLNSRISKEYGEGKRIVATSSDGGVTWSDVHVDDNLPDSRNNAQIIRAFPSADNGTLRAKVLLFSNTEKLGHRHDGKVKMSYDDGKSWPVSKQIRTGHTGYTTMAVQPDGSIGLLMEPTWYSVGYVNFTLKEISKDLPFEVALKNVNDVVATDGTPIAPIKMDSTGNDPALADTYSAEGLPAGLTVNAKTGQIEGTPAVGNKDVKSFDVKVTLTEAEDGTGIPRVSSQTFKIKLAPNPTPAPEPKPEPTSKPTPKVEFVSPSAPVFPGGSDPVTCKVKPFVKIVATKGVTYSVTVDGKDLEWVKDNPSRFEYEYGKTVVVKAKAVEGFELAKDVTAEWSWTAPTREALKCDSTPAPKPQGPKGGALIIDQGSPTPQTGLVHTGATVAGLSIVAAVLLIAGGAVAIIRRRQN